MSLKSILAGSSILLFLCAASFKAPKTSEPGTAAPSPINGSWELYSTTTTSDKKTTVHQKPKQIKVYSDGHFCMMAYNDEGKFDFAVAGTYELDGNHYKETCTYHSNWAEGIGVNLWFDWSKSANGDTLYFSGFKKATMPDGKDVTKDWGGDSFVEKKVRVKP